MSRLRLSMSCEDYDRTRALLDGTVKPEGIDLTVIPLHNSERHKRMMEGSEFDICELSTAEYMAGKTRGVPLTGIPVFPYRKFRHGYIFVNSGAGIDRPADLVGRRIGCPHFINTGSVWVRGMLEDEYGVRFDRMTWVASGQEEVHGWKPPEGLHLELSAPGRSMDDLLLAGEVDAIIWPTALPSIRSRNPKVRRLFPNYREVEIDYYRRTKLFPLGHTVVIKDSVLNENPWVAAATLEAFDRAKRLAYEYHRNEARTLLAWFGDVMAQEREVLGPDPWAYGISANRPALEKMVGYAYDQGVIEGKPQIEDFFAVGSWEPQSL